MGLGGKSDLFIFFDRKKYDNIIKAIPQSIIQMSFSVSQSNVTPGLLQLWVNGGSLTRINLPMLQFGTISLLFT